MSDKKKTEQVWALELDDDESHHLTLVSEETNGRLELAAGGGLLTLQVLKEAGTNLDIGTPDFLVVRGLIRAANLIRFSAKGLVLGYYGGSAASLRSAYEALLYAYLFKHDPKEINSWLRIGLDSLFEQPDIMREERRLLGLARNAFNRETAERHIGTEIWESSSKLIHHNLEGIALECGLAARDLLPTELAASLDATEWDFDSAIRLSELLSRFGESGKQSYAPLPWTGEFGSLFDEETVDFWSLVAVYLAHRTTDFTFENYESADAELKDAYKSWHNAVKKDSTID